MNLALENRWLWNTTSDGSYEENWTDHLNLGKTIVWNSDLKDHRLILKACISVEISRTRSMKLNEIWKN